VLRIGAFASLAGVSVKMLRHYDEIGILVPAHVVPGSGYRYYDAAQLPVVARLVALRQLGFGLDAVRELLAADPPGGRGDAALAERRRALVDTSAEVARRLAALDVFDAAAPVSAKTIPGGAYAVRRGTASHDGAVGDLFVDVEQRVAAAGARAPTPPLTRIHGDDGGEVDVEVAVPVTGEGPTEAVFLPARRVASAVVVGPYTAVSAAADAVLAWLSATGHRPSGPVEEAYVRFGAEPELGLPAHLLAEDDGDFVTEVRIPF
jgi:DNA-binding transcriptional MerR regulator